jgi:hypothetical protein
MTAPERLWMPSNVTKDGINTILGLTREALKETSG